MDQYDALLARWPVPYTTLGIASRYGATFVAASGSESAPPLVLIHGAGSNSAMWAGDVGEYSRHYRVYAVDGDRYLVKLLLSGMEGVSDGTVTGAR